MTESTSVTGGQSRFFRPRPCVFLGISPAVIRTFSPQLRDFRESDQRRRTASYGDNGSKTGTAA
jgi:hypothetical protein